MPWCSHAFEPGTLDPEEDELEEELEELEDIFALRVKNSLKIGFKPLSFNPLFARLARTYPQLA